MDGRLAVDWVYYKFETQISPASEIELVAGKALEYK